MDSYDFNILHEKVSDTDLFEDKTHEKVASNLNKVIRSEQSAVTIGLEGGWGSGKSTVVNLLRGKLSEGEKITLIYLFDAWAHDGDPLRRIFLEGLIDEIVSQDKDQNLTQKLKAIRAEISGKKKKVDVKTRKSASMLGGFLSLSAIFVPLGAALLSSIDYNNVRWFSLELNVHWPFWAGLFFTLAPVWTLGAWRWISEDDPQKGRKGIIFGQKKWDVFESDSEESYTQDITEDGERSSIEFEHYFKKIMDLSIGGQNTYQRALIVIDNLDRIEPDKALSIWSVLQTFFQHRSRADHSTLNWQNHLWFLIPYDRDGLSNVWQASYPHPSLVRSGLAQATESLPPIDRTPGSHTATSFFEKCFQLTEEVPEPILTAWVEYCDSCIRAALIGWPAEASSTVFDTYRRYESSLSRSPTPRQIRAFVNKVGIIGMRWGGTVSAEAIALYALVRRNRSERQLRAELLNQGLPDNYQSTKSALLKSELAGLLFGVDRHKGMQLLLEPEITKALREGDADSLSDLITEHGEGFWVAWASIRSRVLPNGHIEEHRIAVTKAFCKAVENHKDRVELDLILLVNEWKSTVTNWELGNFNYVDAISALVSVLNSDESKAFVAWLNLQIKAKLRLFISEIGKNEAWSDGLDETRKLLDYLNSVGQPVAKFRETALNQNTWLTWLNEIEDYELSFPEVLPDAKAVPALIDAIDPVNAGGEIASKLLTTLEVDSSPSYYDSLTNKLQAWLVHPHHALGLNAPFELLIKCYLRNSENIKESISSSITHPQFIERANNENLEITPSLIALCAIVHGSELLESTTPGNIANFYQTAPSKEMLNKVANVFYENRSLSTIWQLACSSSNAFAIKTIREITEIDLFQVDTAAHYIDEYEWAEEEDVKSIVKNLITSESFESAKDDYIENPLAYSECLRILLQHGEEYGKNFVRDLLPQILTETWKESFKSENDIFKLLDEKGNHEFKDAVRLFAFEEFNEGTITKFFWINLSNIYERLPDRKEVILAIAKKYFDLDSDPFDDILFEQISNCLSGFSFSRIGATRLMRRVEYWISTEQWSRLSWLIGNNFPVPKTPSESLSSRLGAAILTDNEEIRGIVEKLASIYGIKVEKPDQQEDIEKASE